MLAGVVGAAIQGDGHCVQVFADQLELAVFVENIQLGLDGVGTGAAPHDIHGIIEIGLTVDAGDTGAMVGRGDAHAALDPALEHRPLDRVGIHHPAAQEAQVTVLDALPGGVGLVLPMVQLELDRHEVIEDQGPLFLGRDGCQPFKKKTVALFDTLDLQRLGIIVEMTRGDDPGRQVAVIEGTVVHGGSSPRCEKDNLDRSEDLFARSRRPKISAEA